MLYFIHMIELWNHLPSLVSPVAFQFGMFEIRWYSLMYLLAVGTVLLLTRWRIWHDPLPSIPLRDKKQLWNIILKIVVYAFIGLLIGGRIGYIVFYDQFASGWEVLLPVRNGQFTGYSGMSYHGGLAGVLIGSYLACRKHRLPLAAMIDLMIPAISIGYVWGRLGNFLNGELYGRITTVPWGMYFPSDRTGQLRHPSQLYEAMGEGLIIFLLLWPLRNHPALQNRFLALYLILYGSIRFVIEFFRQPELYIGPVTMGQLLCLAMIMAGGILAIYRNRKSTTN